MDQGIGEPESHQGQVDPNPLLGKLSRTFVPEQKERTAHHRHGSDGDPHGTGRKACEQQQAGNACNGASLDA